MTKNGSSWAAALLIVAGAFTLGSCSSDSPTGLTFGPPAALLVEGGQDQSAVAGTELPTALTAKVVDADGRPVRGQLVNFRVVTGGGSVFAGAAITSDSGIARERWTLGTAVADSQRVEARAVDVGGNALVFGVFRAAVRPDVPASVTKVAGDTQTVVVGTPAADSLVVRVVDRFGNPVPQTWVRWAIAVGGGSLSSDSSETNAQGLAWTRWTVGQQVAVAQRVTATVGSLAAQTFQATVQAAVAVGVAVVSPAAGAASGAPFTSAPRVRLVDAFGNTAGGSSTAITLSVSAGGTLLGTTSVVPTAGEGEFTGAGLSGAIGDYTLTYSATDLTGATQAISLVAGAPTAMVITTQPSGAVSGAVFGTQPVVDLRDNAGNRTLSTATVVASVASGDGTLLGTASVAAVAGVATFTDLRIDRAEAHTLTFTVAAPALTATSGAFTVAPGAASQLAVTTPAAGARSGVAFTTQPAIEVRDAAGNKVTGNTAAISATVTTGATVVGGAAISAVDGVATYTTLGLRGTVGTYTVTFAADDLTSATQSVSLTAGPATQLAIVTSAVGAASGVAFTTQPQIESRDAAGNRTTSAANVVLTVSAGGTLVGTATVTPVAGLATFAGLGLSGLVGNYTLTYSATDLTGATQAISLVAGAPTAMVITTQPSRAVSGAVFGTQPVVELRDNAGNRTLSTATVVASVASGGGTLLGTASVAAVAGVATFIDLRIDRAEAHTLTFTVAAPALTATSGAFTVAPGAASQLAITTQPSGAVSGAVFGTQPVVELRDNAGNRTLSTATVVASVASGGGTLLGTASVAAVAGVATFIDLRIDRAEAHTLTFTVASPALTVSSSSVTVVAGAASQLAVTTAAAGAISGEAFTTQPVVEVRDAAGNRVTGSTATVTATVSAGATVVGTATVAAASGIATFSGLGLSGPEESYTMTYAATDLTSVTQTVALATGVQAVSAGSEHTMILKRDGTLWATGDNTERQLGDGTTTSRATPVQVMSGVQAVSAGTLHTMILKTDGTLWATGNNDFGQLGDGTKTSRSTPVQVMTGVQLVWAGTMHTMILKTDGTLWATGNNGAGQLGDGTTTSRATPVQVMSGVQAVSAGGAHTMILKTDGTIWATGWNAGGALGNGTTTNRATPVQVMSGGVQAVWAGGYHTMILKTDGTLWATGDNNYGELGDGTTTARLTPVQVMTGVQAVSAGQSHTMILKTDGTLWATGRGQSGQLGNGISSDRETPVQVMSGVQAVWAGGHHTMILKTDGTLWATGRNKSDRNRFGQLGDGTTIDRNSPVQVLPSP